MSFFKVSCLCCTMRFHVKDACETDVRSLPFLSVVGGDQEYTLSVGGKTQLLSIPYIIGSS